MYLLIVIYTKHIIKEEEALKYILFLVNSTFVDATYNELYGNRDVLLYSKTKGTITNKIRDMHTSVKINKHFNLPFKGIWKHTFFDEKRLGDNEECIFLFEEGNKQSYDEKYINYIKTRYLKSKLFFLYWNSAKYIDSKTIEFIDKNYNYVISFDPLDCLEHNWLHYSGIYSKPKEFLERKDCKFDVVFIGHNKGRLQNIRKLYKLLRDNGFSCLFYVSEVDKEDCISDGIHYNQYLQYKDVVEYVKESKAVLELLQEDQHGSTLRTMEALAYGKILITNNKHLRDERYYKDDQFYIFNDCSSFNIEELRHRISKLSKFEYTGNLSPFRFLDFLKNIYYDNPQK